MSTPTDFSKYKRSLVYPPYFPPQELYSVANGIASGIITGLARPYNIYVEGTDFNGAAISFGWTLEGVEVVPFLDDNDNVVSLTSPGKIYLKYLYTGLTIVAMLVGSPNDLTAYLS